MYLHQFCKFLFILINLFYLIFLSLNIFILKLFSYSLLLEQKKNIHLNAVRKIVWSYFVKFWYIYIYIYFRLGNPLSHKLYNRWFLDVHYTNCHLFALDVLDVFEQCVSLHVGCCTTNVSNVSGRKKQLTRYIEESSVEYMHCILP